jgi:RHS repeat-associated protein
VVQFLGPIITGLVYLRARWYDPATDRFITRDPFRGLAGYPQTQHRHAYAHNNPINLTKLAYLQPLVILNLGTTK